MKITGVLGMMLLWVCSFAVTSVERVRPVKLDELEKRLAQGGDTTFVVNFWATWCVPCVAELPFFERLNADMGVPAEAQRPDPKTSDIKTPVKVLLVSLDAVHTIDRVRDFVCSRDLKSEVLILDESDQQYYIDAISPEWSGVIPATLFVNTGRGVRRFREQEFDYGTLKKQVLSIAGQSVPESGDTKPKTEIIN